MDNDASPSPAPENSGFARAITAATAESEQTALSVPEIGERVAEAVGIDEATARRAVEIVQEYSHGPVPGALELQRLNEISPSLGTDIARDYLVQRQHTRNMDNSLIELAQSESRRNDGWLHYSSRGQAFGMISQFIFVSGAFGAMYLHYPALAVALVAAPALGVITQFIKGVRSRPDIKSTHTPENSAKAE